VLFVMTNAKDEWIEEFKESLERTRASWTRVVTKMDLKFDIEPTGANMVVDMEIARRAAVYIEWECSLSIHVGMDVDNFDSGRRGLPIFFIRDL